MLCCMQDTALGKPDKGIIYGQVKWIPSFSDSWRWSKTLRHKHKEPNVCEGGAPRYPSHPTPWLRGCFSDVAGEGSTGSHLRTSFPYSSRWTASAECSAITKWAPCQRSGWPRASLSSPNWGYIAVPLIFDHGMPLPRGHRGTRTKRASLGLDRFPFWAYPHVAPLVRSMALRSTILLARLMARPGAHIPRNIQRELAELHRSSAVETLGSTPTDKSYMYCPDTTLQCYPTRFRLPGPHITIT